MLKYITNKTKIDLKFIKFLFAGGLNTIFGYSIFAILIFSGFHYTLAVFFSTMLGIFFNFKTIGKIVFKNNSNKLIFKFIGVYTIIYLLNILFLKILKSYNFDIYLAGALLIIPMAMLSFILNKKFVFIQVTNSKQGNGS